MATIVRLCGHGLSIVLLTLLSQLGGIAYVGALAFARRTPSRSGWAGLCQVAIAFVAIYGALLLTASCLAPRTGRVPIPCFAAKSERLVMHSPIYCLLNRNYVTPSARRVAQQLADHVDSQFPGTLTLALDGSFPFFDGFPLLPHLSHNDGRKLDIALYYRIADGAYARGRTRSPIGYWAFERPTNPSQEPCSNVRGHLRWEMRWFEPLLNDRYEVDQNRTAAALYWLSSKTASASISRVFVEPHLRKRFNVKGAVLRFQGCHAARHDDHIHIEVRR